ncbi:hypothetical protein EIKCOROL_01855 [Eikenella corrodens ATCC 23834]|uniref:Uncharacterized protein n=1 Tax=Eikenella corrodens ATCC 23834 TaxID=546274 RepID=C0DWV2_EIKCO|nr:hypothetical protein EIKCOROL_01855 [Eikenella corrodens ATCC 23834]
MYTEQEHAACDRANERSGPPYRFSGSLQRHRLPETYSTKGYLKTEQQFSGSLFIQGA